MSNIIWIDPEIDNLENSYYVKELNSFLFSKVKCYKDIDEGLNILKRLNSQIQKLFSVEKYIKFL